MATGNFSNGGRDTHDPAKRYIGVRLQQGVPLLDRDWNEAEDIRRDTERRILRNHVGQGVPDVDGFAITAPGGRAPAPNDFVIEPGSCTVDGYQITNPRAMLYSQQTGNPQLPPPDAADTFTVYLQTRIARIGAADEPSLQNTQDINLETCLRDRIDWMVAVVRAGQPVPADGYVLAEIARPAGSPMVTSPMISDKRRTLLNLATTVDRTEVLEQQASTLGGQVNDLRAELERVRQQLARMFWDVSLSVPPATAYFGSSVPITAAVVNSLGEPVNGAHLSFTTDWGVVEPSSVMTARDGRATVHLQLVEAEAPPPKSEMTILNEAVRKVEQSVVGDGGVIRYDQLRFEPREMSLISKYTPPATLRDLSVSLPDRPVVSIPRFRTATVNVHSKEGQGAIVRGIGSVQVRAAMWVRDWAVTKVVDVVKNVQVGVRMGDLLRQGVGGNTFDTTRVVQALPRIMQTIQDDTHRNFKQSVLVDATVDDDQLTTLGSLGQVISKEVTAAIGGQSTQAISTQIAQFRSDPVTAISEPVAREAQLVIGQKALEITAGFTQSHKQRFNSTRLGR